MQDPWSLYWQSDNLDSCVTSKSRDDALAIAAFWKTLAERLVAGAEVLDLATGNGTVPASLLNSNDSLKIMGVDRASIDPLKFLSEPGRLSGVRFQPDVDICALSFEDGRFDAVTSQFGVEYAPLEQAIPEFLRVTRPGGQIQLLLHHADSDIVVPSRSRRREMDALLVPGGVLATLRAFLDGQKTDTALETAGESHLSSSERKTRQISGQIFEGVNRVISSAKRGDMRAADELCNVMTRRITADRDRLVQLDAAALGPERFQEVISLLADSGAVADLAAPLHAGDGTDDDPLIGWQYSATKT
jgi:SAM-dependent methyltransferase